MGETRAESSGNDALVEEGSAFLHMTKQRVGGTGGSGIYDVIVIGAGQAGLSVGWYLAKQGLSFVILDANERIGDSWRRRWDSLRLFSPARFDGLVGMPFPAPPHSFPTKDEMADYLEAYARRFALPVENGVRVDRLSREGDRYVVEAGGRRFEAAQVVVAMATYQKGRVPPFAAELDSGTLQLHTSDYRNPSQLRPGSVLVVGAGNSGAEIALDVARARRAAPVWMSGRDVGHVPFRIGSFAARWFIAPLLFRIVFHRLFTTDTALGRKVRPKMISRGALLIRVKPEDLLAAGIERVARVTGAREGKPLLADGRVLEPANVIWATGFHPGLSWIDLPIPEDELGEPKHRRGIVESEPGLYFVGLHFLYAFSSTMIHGIQRDAEHVAAEIGRRAGRLAGREAGRPTQAPAALAQAHG